jgi:hypothetical protein
MERAAGELDEHEVDRCAGKAGWEMGDCADAFFTCEGRVRRNTKVNANEFRRLR